MKTSTFIFLSFFSFFFHVENLYAKEISKISGQILDQTGKPVAYANVALIGTDNGGLMDGAVSDENGEFLIESSKSAKVKLVVSSIGFKQVETEPFELLPGLQRNMGIIVIEDEMTGLDQVTVKATRPEIIIEADKTIVNVAGTVMAEGSNALDVVGRSPGVYIDQDGIINLNGRAGVTVMINDRPTYMSAGDLTNFLRAMPTQNIKSIEVINNPSARFDAEGSAGVINIVLKKNTVDGTFGHIQVGGTYNGQWAPISGISLNVKKGKWSTNANLNYNENARINEIEIERNFKINDGEAKFFQNSEIVNRYKSLFFNGSTNYEINKNQNIGFNLQASDNSSTGINTSLTNISSSLSSDVNFLDSYNDDAGGSSRVFANLHYDVKLDTLGAKLSSDVDYTRMNSNSQALLTNQYWEGADRTNLRNDRIQTLNEMFYTIFTAKVDLVKPLRNGATLEAGVKGSWVKSDNDLDLSRSLENGPFEDQQGSNRFIYAENVLAAYTSYKGKVSEKLSFQAGLRGEYSNISGNSLTLEQLNTQQYFNMFPSVFLQQKVSDSYQIVYTANRRITRPNYRLLNPFIYYIDPLTSDRGNPNLKPQYSNNFEMKHVIKAAYQVNVAYSVTEDAFMQVFEQDQEARTTMTFTDNFDKTKNLNFTAIVPVDVRSWWSTSNMVQVNHNQVKSQLKSAYLDISQTSFLVRTQHNMSLPKGFKLELVGMYLGPQIFGQGSLGGFGWVDAGVTKSLMKDKITLSVNGTDIFRTQIIRATIDFGDIDTRFRQYQSNQGVRFTLKYNFSKGESFRVKSSSGSAEERNRLD